MCDGGGSVLLNFAFRFSYGTAAAVLFLPICVILFLFRRYGCGVCGFFFVFFSWRFKRERVCVNEEVSYWLFLLTGWLAYK